MAYGDSVLCCLQVNLENGTLDQAVQALKGAPRGMVRILVAKPLALPEIGESSTDDVVSTAPPFSLLMLFHGLIFLISWPKHGGNFLVFLDTEKFIALHPLECYFKIARTKPHGVFSFGNVHTIVTM